MTTSDQPTLEHLPNVLNDAYIDLFKAGPDRPGREIGLPPWALRK